MIDKIELTNYESHPHSELVFVNGVNVITGSSDNGKSAVIRALLWALRNPQGDAMVSNFIKKRGKQVGVTSVAIDKDGHHIVREKSRVKDGNAFVEFNGYHSDFGDYSACRSTVPPEIANALNLADCNISTQFAPHFLLDNTAGEVSKYLNSVVGLDAQDIVLANLDRRHRSWSRELERMKESAEEKKKQIAGLGWTAKAKRKLNDLKKKIVRQSEVSSKLKEINGLVSDYNKITICDDDKLLKMKDLLAKIKKLDTASKEQRLNALWELIADYPTAKPLPDMSEYLNTLQNLNKRLLTKDSDLGSITTLINDYDKAEAIYKEGNERLKRLRGELERLAKESKQICPHSGKYCQYWSEA